MITECTKYYNMPHGVYQFEMSKLEFYSVDSSSKYTVA